MNLRSPAWNTPTKCPPLQQSFHRLFSFSCCLPPQSSRLFYSKTNQPCHALSFLFSLESKNCLLLKSNHGSGLIKTVYIHSPSLSYFSFAYFTSFAAKLLRKFCNFIITNESGKGRNSF